MLETDWLKGADPDKMRDALAPRLSPRRWHLLACAAVRRAGDALPDGPFRDAIEWAERLAGRLPNHPGAAGKLAELEALVPAVVETARQVQRQIVLPADPDADPDDFKHNAARKTNPSAPYFQAACRNAGAAVELAGRAAEQATRAVGALLTEPPGAATLARVRESVVEATRLRSSASLHASVALDLKARGDDAADRATGKNVNLQYAAALETVQKIEEQTGTKDADFHDHKAKADRKAIARFLHELAGNPFKPYRFEPAWRTSTVVGLAKAIYDERAFDRLPILADALLDADCDEEAILRHCRGTEPHALEQFHHARGCWVLDLILEQEAEFFAGPPLAADKPPPPPRRPARPPTTGPSFLKLFEAIKKGTLPDDEE